MAGERYPKGLDQDTATFILDEHELRRHEERKAQIAPPGKKIEVVTTTNIEEVKGKGLGEPRERRRERLS